MFTRAARAISELHIQSDVDLGPLLESPPPGLDPDVLTQLRHMYEAGAWVLLESAIADIPADLRWLYESGAVTLTELSVLHETLGVTAAADLLAEVRRGGISKVPGISPDVEAAIAAALPALRAAMPPLPLPRAFGIADMIVRLIREMPDVPWALPAGSLRRGDDMVGDIEIVAPAMDPGPIFDRVASLPDFSRQLHRSASRMYFLLDRVQIGVRCPPPETAGAVLLHLTGSRAHLEGLQALAAGRDWRLEPDGLRTGDNSPPVGSTEQEIYAALDLPLVPAELRGGIEGLEAAANGTLPRLVTRADILGDLHMHSDWSDGRDSIETMAKECVALGYEYLAITDHSPHSAASRNLSVDAVQRQADEIASVRERYPQIVILHGCEVDILPDGKLDFSDRVLERFDIVLASLHEPAGQSGDQLLKRYAGAMRHPLVSIITHPANRLVPRRRGYDIDYAAFFAAAVETHTVLEIDGAPSHLDMDGPLAHQAIRAGATVVVDSDCHRAEMLDRQMAMGLLMARRGWVEARHVLNARPVSEVRALIRAKRSR